MKPLAIFMLCWLLAATVVDAGVIELRDRVTLPPGSVVRLGDVAAIHEADDRRAISLRELPLGPAPAAGRTLAVTYDEVRQKLQARGENLAAIEFRGQRQVMVTSATPTATPMAKSEPVTKPEPTTKVDPVASPLRLRPRQTAEDEEQRAEALLKTVLQRVFKLSEPGTSVDFECQVNTEDAARVVRCRPEELHFLSAELRGDTATPLTAWWIDASTGERHEARVMVKMTPRPQRLAVRYATPKGFPLRPDDLMWVDANETEPGLSLLGDAVSMETTRNLRAGQALVASDVVSVPLMRTNDIVSVVVRRGGISVRREFKALASGSMNDTVSLVALNDPRLRIQAVVTGYREATIADTPLDPNAVGSVRFEEQRVERPAVMNRSVR